MEQIASACGEEGHLYGCANYVCVSMFSYMIHNDYFDYYQLCNRTSGDIRCHQASSIKCPTTPCCWQFFSQGFAAVSSFEAVWP